VALSLHQYDERRVEGRTKVDKTDGVTDTSVDAVKDLLRTHGLQATGARIAVLQVLRGEHHHRSIEELRAAVLERYPTIDPATVYRTMETLAEHGLAVRMELADKRTRWAYATHDHHHLVCRTCKAVVELDNEPFRRLAADLHAQRGVVVDMHHLVLQGLCPDCAAGE
jgi:Fur family ferric uptake transcriptional regulator